MTDNAIIKALACHRKGLKYCNECPLQEPSLNVLRCNAKLLELVIDLIKRQQEEIERLKNEICDIDTVNRNLIKEKAEAIKEFAQELKDRTSVYSNAGNSDFIQGCVETVDWYDSKIDDLVKEMVGDDNDK